MSSGTSDAAGSSAPHAIKRKIIYKGLAFILLPLLLQIVSFFMLFQLTQHAEQLAVSEARQARAVMLMDSLATEFANSLGLIGNYIYGGKGDIVADANEYRGRLQPLITQGRTVFANNTHMLDVLAEANQLEEEQYRALVSLSGMHFDRHSVDSVLNGLIALKPSLTRLGRSVGKINAELSAQRIELERARHAEEANRLAIKSQVVFGVVADVVLTVVLLSIFISGITKRLKTLVSNAQQLPKGQPLTQTVTGNDEIAFLDTVLHDAARDLNAAAQNRKQIMEMVAHDLRSPIASSTITLDRLLSRMKEKYDRTDVEDVENTKNSLSTVVSLVEDLLTIDKLESGTITLHRDLIEVRPLIQESFRTVAGVASAKNIKLSNEVEEVAVEADRQRLLQVLNNLLSNAIKFSPQGGTVKVSTEIAPTQMKFVITDEGPGIPAEVQQRVFDRFYQDGGVQGGFGLGLAIVKLIVGAHHGEVGVASEPGKGSAFWFTLPMDVDLSDL